MSYAEVPANASLKPVPFKAHVSDEQLSSFKQLLSLSPIGPVTYENQQEDRRFGVTHKWLTDAKERWLNTYSWRETEKYINSLPNFTVKLQDPKASSEHVDVHFVALFSKKTDATPLLLLHGWPGSFLEFTDLLEALKSKYDPESLPYHVIVPSLPGYGYSSGPTVQHNTTTEDMASILNSLMTGLGFTSYVAQGGDIGSFASRILGSKYDACKAVHLNFSPLPRPSDLPEGVENTAELKGLERMRAFTTTGNAYAREHGTRPATIGAVLSSSPIALLAWIGEKFLEWSDEDPPLDKILDDVTLYWFTQCFPRSIYPYRQFHGAQPLNFTAAYYIDKPLGYSWFPLELMPIPKAWVEKTGRLVWSKQHTEGGHFAAMEKPKLLLQDIEEFIAQVKSSPDSKL